VIPTRSALRRSLTRGAAALLAVLVAVGGSPLPPADAVAEPGPPPNAELPEGVRPSIAYEEAMAYADQEFAFEPGGRADVPFRPRPDDTALIDGKAPRALPAGRASGLEIARSARDGRWSADMLPLVPPAGPHASGAPDKTPTPAPVDAPSNDDAAMPASGSAFAGPDAALEVLPAGDSGLRKEVFGFLPYWELSNANTLNYELLSTIAYFGIGATSTGALSTSEAGWNGWTSAQFTNVINAAHAKGTRVVLTVQSFAWTTSQANTQKSLLGSATARQNLAVNIATAVRNRGIGGVNLDFEPLVSGYESQFVDLIKRVRTEFNKIAPGYQITYDTTGWIGNYPLEASVAAGAADAIFIMGYDYRTASSSYVGSIDPLSGPAYDLADTVRAYTARVPGSRIILGLPWYGRAWSTVSDQVNARNQSGTQYGASTSVTYRNVVPLVSQYGRRWDTREQSPWIAYRRENCTTTYGCVTSWRQVYYDDAQSLKLRYDLVNSYGLRGAGIWALGYDGGRTEMWSALAEKFLEDKTPPGAGVHALAATVRDEGIVVRWSAADVSPITAYDVQVSVDGGPWTAWITGTLETSEVYPGTDGRGYAFRVRAKDSNGNVSAWNVTAVYEASPALGVGKFGRTRVENLSYRSGPTTSATRLGTLPINTTVAITGGPVSADGYTWWEVTQPVAEWGPVSFVERGVWIAGGSSSEAYVVPVRAPNATLVSAGLRGLSYNGAGLTSVGTAAAATRTFSPNGDGVDDTIALDWTTAVTLDSLQVRIWRADGTLLGSRALTALTPGTRRFTWDGKVDGTIVPEGTYVLQLVGAAGGTTYTAPSAQPTMPSQVAAHGITVLRTSVSRLAGADRYATAVEISKANFSPGVPVVYVANGLNFPDALAGAAVAGGKGAPMLLVPRDTVPASVAAELTRLKPAAIVVLGGTGMVLDTTMWAARAAGAAGH
jgi:spore germination protein YaaH